MKKSLIALAVLGSMVGAAAAQSSVTLFGGVDLNVRYNKGGGQTTKSMGSDGIYSSRWGLRGVEDLGGGLKAGFWLESAINPDSGTPNGKRFWHRRASVSLMGDFGEVRLGRYLTNQFTAFADFDPFGTNGVGDVNKFFAKEAHPINGNISGSTRADNIVGYFLPSNLGGFYGSVEVAAGEGQTLPDPNNKYIGVRVGYAQGPFNVSGAFSSNDPDTSNIDYKRTTFSGSYDLGVVKLMGFYSQNKFGSAKQKIGLIGASAPLGSGTVRASYTKATNTSQIAVGYIHDLSKRTALYGTVARVDNKPGSSARVAGTDPWIAGIKSGFDNGGVEVGIRHTF
ncbi:porin [Roseateles sp. DAIF2]|uniref:porin n=1 Tax=Roseateles sp. DAIF2 TaxID=2714952 RepID=UPI0018A25D47|nr:porin [Roseateles sp. DAIF2]QPF72524.1 porin [Roseateles sp. DAIF2]